MPPINQAAFASAGVIAISVAVAAAIAVYESPEIQRMAQDLRRRIAVALHSLGDEINPALNRDGQPMFNRPEDAEGFLESRGVVGADLGVEADDESRRRQREELMYWNAIKESKELVRIQSEKSAAQQEMSARGSSFDDFMLQDKSGEKGTFVFKTGADVNNAEGLVRRRGAEGVRGLNSSLYANPFADEYGIDNENLESSHISPAQDEVMSEATDIYNATEKDASMSRTLSPAPLSPPALINIEERPLSPLEDSLLPKTPGTSEELSEDEYMTAGQDQNADAYASIQAWTQSSNPSFYSPLPVSPSGPRSEFSEPEMISEGQLTPTDSISLAGSGEDIANDAASRAGDDGRYYDVISDDEDDGMGTPVSWSEVGSVVSESEDGARNPVAA